MVVKWKLPLSAAHTVASRLAEPISLSAPERMAGVGGSFDVSRGGERGGRRRRGDGVDGRQRTAVGLWAWKTSSQYFPSRTTSDGQTIYDKSCWPQTDVALA